MGRLVVVLGLRRFGKTPLILTGLNEAGLDYVSLDCRLLPPGMLSMGSFLSLLESGLNRRSWAKKLLRKIEGVSVGEFGVRFKERGSARY